MTSPLETGAERRGRMLAVLCFATFLATSTGIAIAPFLLDIARDLQTDLAAVANLISLLSVSWGATSLVAGAASDRLGRRPLLAAGLLVLGAALLGLATAGVYGQLVVWQLLGGIGGGAYMGTVFAAVSDHVPAGQRGRALGWVITGQSLSLVLGVPLATLIGSNTGWRGAVLTQAAAVLVTAVAVWLVVPRAEARPARRRTAGAPLWKVLNLRVLGLLGAGTMERACFASLAVYLATYLITTYGIQHQELAIGLALVALGNLAGNMVGSQLTDRLPARPLLFAASSAATAALALPLLLWPAGLVFSLGLGFAYALANALGRPALLAALSAVPNETRGTVLGLNITFASFGWLAATALGGVLITAYGFGSLGLLCAATGLLGAALASMSWLADRRQRAL